MSRNSRRIRQRAGVLLTLAVSGCLPFTYGTTAAVTPVNESRRALMLSAIPKVENTSRSGGYEGTVMNVDVAFRTGVSDRADVGLRLNGGSGFVGSYKRRFASTSFGPGLAVEPQVGVLEFARSALFGITIVASTAESQPRGLYGGLRVLATTPLRDEVLRDQPSIGVFVGARLGDDDLGIRPEIGVFRDPSAQGRQRSDWIVVPGVTIRAETLLRRVFPGRTRGIGR